MASNLIYTEEACKILGITQPTLSRWVQAGKLSPIGGTVRPHRNTPYLFERAHIEAVATEK